MGRKILAVVAGYLVMFVAVFLLFSGAYLAMGAGRAFKPGTYDVTGLWNAISVVLSLVAAFLGGRVAARLGGSRSVRALVVVVLVLGLLMAIPSLQGGPPTEPRTAEIGNMAAMQKAKTPAWMALLNPFLGAVGVLYGGRTKPSKP